MNNIFGYIAAILGFLVIWPQIIKSFRTKSVNDISITMWLLLIATNTAWVIHAILKQDIALLIANAVSGISSIIMLYLKIQYNN